MKASIWAVLWLFSNEHESASAGVAVCQLWWAMAESVQHGLFL